MGFAPAAMLVDKNVGDTVTFELGVNFQGQPQAIDLQLADAHSMAQLQTQMAQMVEYVTLAQQQQMVEQLGAGSMAPPPLQLAAQAGMISSEPPAKKRRHDFEE